MKKANCTYKIALEKAFLVGMQNICTDQNKILQKWWLSFSQLKKKQMQKFSTYKTKRGDILLGDNVYLELSMLPGRNWWDTLLFSLEFKGSLAGVCALPTLSCFGTSVSRTVLFKCLHGKEQDFQNQISHGNQEIYLSGCTEGNNFCLGILWTNELIVNCSRMLL